MKEQPVTAESIARDEGRDVSSYFTNEGKMMPPLESGEMDSRDEETENVNKAG